MPLLVQGTHHRELIFKKSWYTHSVEDYVANGDGRAYEVMEKPPRHTFRRSDKDNTPGHIVVDA